MRNRPIYFALIVILLSSCTAQINTKDAQASTSIKQSMAKDLFIRACNIESKTDSNIVIEEAWVEYIWFNKVIKGRKSVEKIDECQLCFRIKQTTNHKFNINDKGNWSMKDSTTDNYVGVNYNLTNGKYNGVYCLTLDHCERTDITIVLMEMADTGTDIVKKNVGSIVFKSKL